MAWYDYIEKILYYFRKVMLADVLFSNVKAWADKARSPEGPGGADITLDEYLELSKVIADSIMQAYGQEVEVSIKPK